MGTVATEDNPPVAGKPARMLKQRDLSRNTMNTFPVNLLLKSRKCLLVGGGKVASRKLLKLLDSGAEIMVIAPECSGQIRALAAEGRIELHQRSFQDSDLDGAFLVYAATDDHALNLKITGLA